MSPVRAAERFRRGAVAIALCAAMGGAVVLGSIRLAEAGAAVAATQAQIAALSGQNALLQARLGALQSPQRIELEAVTTLGLHRPASYVPVPVGAPGAAAKLPPTQSAVVAVPLLPGPAPGGPLYLWRGVRAAVRSLWRRIAA